MSDSLLPSLLPSPIDLAVTPSDFTIEDDISLAATGARCVRPEGDAMTKHLNEFAFKPGQSGNPNGRPKGSRNKLAETFLADVYAEWETGGRQAVKEMVAERPSDFVRMVASLMPKEVKTQTNPLAELSEEELEALLLMVRALKEDNEANSNDAQLAH